MYHQECQISLHLFSYFISPSNYWHKQNLCCVDVDIYVDVVTVLQSSNFKLRLDGKKHPVKKKNTVDQPSKLSQQRGFPYRYLFP
jgi:hypothetical protein